MFRFRQTEKLGATASKGEIQYDVICLGVQMYWNGNQTENSNLLDGERYVNTYTL